MGQESLYVIVLQLFIAKGLASYLINPYVQYAGIPYPSPGYITSYPAQSYTPVPAPVYAQPYARPASGYEPAYAQATANTGRTPSYIQSTVGYQQAYAQSPVESAGGRPASYAQPTTGTNKQATANPAVTQHQNIPAVYAKQAHYQTPAYQQPSQSTPLAPPNTLTPNNIDPIVYTNPYISKENLAQTKLSPVTKSDALSGSVPPFDSNVLNNLAIALQLLIVSNLIHNPPSRSDPVSEILDDDVFSKIASFPIAYVPPAIESPVYEYPQSPQYSMPNANFLGTSGFVDTGIPKSMMSAYGSPTPANQQPPRSMGLMSPYDAIAPNSPYSVTYTATKEPRSPYHLSSDYNDLFSLTELFKV